MSKTSLGERMEKINNSAMTPEEQERVNLIIEKQQDMLSVRQDQIPRWEDNIKRQSFKKNISNEEAALDGKSNIRIPMEFAYVETKTADEMEILPTGVVLPTEPSDVEQAKEFQKVFDFVMDNVLNVNELYFRMNIHKNTMGDAFLKPYWCTEKKTVSIPMVKKNSKTGEKEITYKKEKITIFDDIKVDLIDVRQLLIDPIVFQSGKTMEDAQYCEFVSVYELEAFKSIFGNREGYKNIDMVTSSGQRIMNQSAPSQQEQNSNIRNNLVEVVEHWDILNDELTIIANDIEIRHTPIPYFNPVTKVKQLPLAHFVGHMIMTGFYNVGEIDLTKELVEERQGQRNINFDASKGYTHPFIISGGNNDVDSDEFIWGVNSIMNVEDVNQMKQFSMAGNSGLPFSLESANQNDAIVVTGNDVTGILPVPGQTATETLEKKESAIKRTRMTTKYNELNGYRKLYLLIKNLILQFYGPEEADRITKPGRKGKPQTITIRGTSPEGKPTFFEIDKEVLSKDYDIMIVANNQIPASREIKKLRDQEALATIGALPFDPETGQLPKHLVPAVKKVLQNMELTDQEIQSTLGLQQEEGTSELQEAQQAAVAEGLEVEGVSGGGGESGLADAIKAAEGEGLSFERGGTPKNASEGGIQQNVQKVIAS